MAIKAVTADGLRYLVTKLKQALAPRSHASAGTEHGTSSATLYGHAKAGSSTPKAPTTSGSTGAATTSFAREDHAHPRQAMDKATATSIGAVKPDGTTTQVDGNGVINAVPPTERAMFLAAHKVGTYLETDGADPSQWGGSWTREPSMGAFAWRRES